MRGQVAADRRADKERRSGNWKARPEMEEVSLMLERSDLEVSDFIQVFVGDQCELV